MGAWNVIKKGALITVFTACAMPVFLRLGSCAKDEAKEAYQGAKNNIKMVKVKKQRREQIDPIIKMNQTKIIYNNLKDSPAGGAQKLETLKKNLAELGKAIPDLDPLQSPEVVRQDFAKMEQAVSGGTVKTNAPAAPAPKPPKK